jgi:hypothetical protein
MVLVLIKTKISIEKMETKIFIEKIKPVQTKINFWKTLKR